MADERGRSTRKHGGLARTDRSGGLGLAVFLVFLPLPGCRTASEAGADSGVLDPTRRTENVILITLDGVRTREMFGGYDIEIGRTLVDEKSTVEDHPLYRRYWAPTPEERRAKLMPFFWKTLMEEHGSIAGNRALGSTVELANTQRFSYPGYAEILTGEARDDTIRSNDKVRNPYPTVLEFLRKKLELDTREVASFASWEVFDWIVEHAEGTITSSAGREAYGHPDPLVRELSELQFLTPTPWDGVRHDAYTFRFATAHLERWRPRVLYIAFDETDDWAHDGRYDRVLETLERTDGFLRRLWELLESDERYRGKTTLVLTTDHGRGNTAADWRDHGSDIEGAQYIWLAVVSPDSSLRGEWRDAPPISADRIAATICRFLGVDFAEWNPEAGQPIERLFER